MTTIVTVKTTGHPAQVSENSNHEITSKGRHSQGWNTTTHFVPPSTTRDFTVTDTCTVSVQELATDATDLPRYNNHPTPATVAAEAPAMGDAI